MYPSEVNRQFFRGVLLVAEKDMRIYYTKPPVLMFGFLFPLFMFLAFFFGREADLHAFFPGLLAMFVFFIASSVGPLITPWEKRAGTYERLLSFPVTVNTLILGDVVAGMLYGIIINLIILVVGVVALGYTVSVGGALLMAVSLLLGAFCFSSLGVLLASPASTNPSNIMMLSSLVRFPLIFISGIFVPIASLHGIATSGRLLFPDNLSGRWIRSELARQFCFCDSPYARLGCHDRLQCRIRSARQRDAQAQSHERPVTHRDRVSTSHRYVRHCSRT